MCPMNCIFFLATRLGADDLFHAMGKSDADELFSLLEVKVLHECVGPPTVYRGLVVQN